MIIFVCIGHVNTHVHTCINKHIRTCVYIYIYIYTHTRTYRDRERGRLVLLLILVAETDRFAILFKPTGASLCATFNGCVFVPIWKRFLRMGKDDEHMDLG